MKKTGGPCHTCVEVSNVSVLRSQSEMHGIVHRCSSSVRSRYSLGHGRQLRMEEKRISQLLCPYAPANSSQMVNTFIIKCYAISWCCVMPYYTLITPLTWTKINFYLKIPPSTMHDARNKDEVISARLNIVNTDSTKLTSELRRKQIH